MSKLNGMQIFELLSNVNDSLIAESVPAAWLAGGAAAVSAAGTAGVLNPSSATTASASSTVASSTVASTVASTAAKTGFAAWLAKGGWIALTAGVLVAAGIAVGAFLLGNSEDTPPVDPNAVTTEEPSLPAGIMTEEPTQPETESETPAETEPEPEKVCLPLRLTDFSQVDLSLFTTYQCDISVTEEGHLLFSANWPQGSSSGASFSVRPHALMAYAPEQINSAVYTPGAILFKLKRVNGDNGTVSNYFLGSGEAEADAGHAPQLQHTEESTGYEYVILRTDLLDTYMNGAQPCMTMSWIYLGSDHAYSDGRTMTVEEMIFYPASEDALMAFSGYLEGEGIQAEVVYSGGYDAYCAVGSNPNYTNVLLQIPSRAPDGRAVKDVNQNAFRNNTFLFALTIDEGTEYIRDSAFESCSSLTVAYLPDSLTYLGTYAFNNCTAMTEIHLGSGLRMMENWALPLGSEVFTDIYYNGTVADWYRIVRVNTTVSHPITVHCTDGDVDYSDPAPDDLPETVEIYDLTDILAKAEPIYTAEGETVVDQNATVIHLKQGKYGTYKDVILRYAVADNGIALRYCFDILSLEDGSILAAPVKTDGFILLYEVAGMFYTEAAISGERDPMIFFYNYELNENNDLYYRTMYYGIACEEDGTVTLSEYYYSSPDLTEMGNVTYRSYKNHELVRKIRVLMTLEDDLKTERFGSVSRYLIADDPSGNTTVFAPSEAPTFSYETVNAVSMLTMSQIVEQGLPAFYEQYGPHKEG